MRSKQLAIALLLVSSCHAVQAPKQATDHPRVITMTRTAKLFGDLESQVFEAIRKKDPATLDQLLAPDFEVRHADDPGTPEPREDAIRRETSSYTLRDYRIRDVAVHSYGPDTAVVSFLCVEDAQTEGKSATRSRMMVDVWRQANGAWKLAVRYVSESVAKPPVKPTGRE